MNPQISQTFADGRVRASFALTRAHLPSSFLRTSVKSADPFLLRNSYSPRKALNHRGFTLLELILAMVLMSLVLIALTMAIDFQFRVVDATRAQVEEAQLARVLLHQIADDLRSAASSAPAEQSSGLAASSSSADAMGAEPEEEAEDAGSRETGDTSGGAKSSDEEASDDSFLAAEASSSLPAAGICGGPDWIEITGFPTPRGDLWNRLLAASEDPAVSNSWLGMTTISYSLEEASSTAMEDLLPESRTDGGLVRRQYDAGESATLDLGLEGQGESEPLAPEVTSLGFRYSDGTEWLDSWDMDDNGQLPAAVEITLTLRSLRSTRRSAALNVLDATAVDDGNALVYRLVVNLPTTSATPLSPMSPSASSSEDDMESEESETEKSDASKDADDEPEETEKPPAGKDDESRGTPKP